MKNKIAILLCALFTVVCAMSFSGNGIDERADLGQVNEAFYAPGTSYTYAYTLDTITNAANDTLYIPANYREQLSDFQVCVSVTRTNISGTTNIAVKVEETAWPYSGSTAPTLGWASALNVAGSAAATAATTATTENITIPHIYGRNLRIIVDGTGTQSSSYRIRWLMKKKA